jgi:hypothetical protein
MRVLSYETQPPVRLEVARDGADNFTVRALDPGVSGPHRLVFLVDAPATYFAPRIPREVTLPQVAAVRAPAPLPPRVRRAAQRVLDRLGVAPGDPAATALDKLVAYFRAFEAGAPPSPTGDVYLDLALSQRGVCRHRAFAFVITALAAGLPARYVTNEAHAFAEVWLPDNGWARVDLGGAALELEIANAGDKVMHRPRGPDPFPKPRAYAENYTRLRGPVAGLSGEQLAEAHRPQGPATPSDDPTSTEPVAAGVTDLLRGGAAAARPAASGEPAKGHLSLRVDGASRSGFRGEAIRVAGRATPAEGSASPAGLRIDLYLAPAGAQGRGARVVGRTVTDAQGRFEVAVELPADLALGRHEIFAVTAGNAEVGPAISD